MPRVYISIHVFSSLASLTEEKFSSTPRFLKSPHFSSTPEKRGRSRVTLFLSVVQRFGARERGSRDGDGSIDVSPRDYARVFFLFFFEIRKREMYISRTEERKRDTNFFSPLMKIGWEFKRARVDQEKKKIRFA